MLILWNIADTDGVARGKFASACGLARPAPPLPTPPLLISRRWANILATEAGRCCAAGRNRNPIDRFSTRFVDTSWQPSRSAERLWIRRELYCARRPHRAREARPAKTAPLRGATLPDPVRADLGASRGPARREPRVPAGQLKRHRTLTRAPARAVCVRQRSRSTRAGFGRNSPDLDQNVSAA